MKNTTTEIVEFQNQPKLKFGFELGHYSELNNDIDSLNSKIKNLANNFISIGYYLNKIKENKYFDSLGFKDIYEFAELTYKFSKTSVKNFISVANKFGYETEFSGYKLKSKFENYNFSQLVELLPEDESNLEKYSPEQSIKEMRLIKFSKNIENDYNKIFDWLKKDLIEHLKDIFKQCKFIYYDVHSFWTFLIITYKNYDLKFHFSKKECLLEIDCYKLEKSFVKKQILSLKLIDQTINLFIKKVDTELNEKETNKVNNQIKSDVGPTEVFETESVEVEVVDSLKEVKIQTLKNNKQREEYINNDSSYVLIDLLSNNFIQIYELINTPFIKIKVLSNGYNFEIRNPSFSTLGFYKLCENGALSSLLSYNESSIVAWLRDNKI